MNDAHHAGVSARLEVRIKSKDHFSRSGAREAVLRDIAFALSPGEIGAIFGPSGCGKTTLLRIIAGLDPSFEGRVELPEAGRPVRIGMAFQEPRLLPWRTVEENVRLAAPGASEAKLDRLFAALDLEAYRRHHPGQLSLGLARRAALVRALAVDPALLLLDEPFVSLDLGLALKLRATMAAFIDAHRVTTVLVTHNPGEAVALADRIFVLSARPARMVTTVPIDLPRDRRTLEWVASTWAKLAERGFLPSSV